MIAVTKIQLANYGAYIIGYFSDMAPRREGYRDRNVEKPIDFGFLGIIDCPNIAQLVDRKAESEVNRFGGVIEEIALIG